MYIKFMNELNLKLTNWIEPRWKIGFWSCIARLLSDSISFCRNYSINNLFETMGANLCVEVFGIYLLIRIWYLTKENFDKFTNVSLIPVAVLVPMVASRKELIQFERLQNFMQNNPLATPEEVLKFKYINWTWTMMDIYSYVLGSTIAVILWLHLNIKNN